LLPASFGHFGEVDKVAQHVERGRDFFYSVVSVWSTRPLVLKKNEKFPRLHCDFIGWSWMTSARHVLGRKRKKSI
jgi:hypothetical protein